MGRGASKAERLQEMIYLYHQRAYSDAEMAERLGIDRTTAFRYRQELIPNHLFEEEGESRYRINRASHISHIDVDLHEALALYLAARRASRQTRIAQPHAASALEKLAIALKQPMTERLTRAAGAILEQSAQPERVQILETITRAWVERCKLRLTYKALHARQPRQHVVYPYLIEPSLWSDGIYLIGHSETHHSLATFKVERIEQAEKSIQRFDLPEDFDENELLRHAWGIWYGEAEPVTVKLRFRPGPASRRVAESVWHPNQKPLVMLADGGCLWEAAVAEWQEMLPWVRGWGADLEVLEPKEMREAVMAEVRKMARRYGLGLESQPGAQNLARLLRLWGKTVRGSEDMDLFHPALYHMLDVGHVAQALLDDPASPRWRTILSRALGSDPQGLKDWLPWLIAMHDVGKISAAFQENNPLQRLRLSEEGFNLGSQPWKNHPYHAQTSALFIQDGLDNPVLPESLRQVWQEAIAAHHGEFSGREALRETRRLLRNEPPEWDKLRRLTSNRLHDALVKAEPTSWPTPGHLSAAIMALAGFLVICDWIGSDEKYFAPQPETPWNDYLLESKRRAQQAVERAGFTQKVFSLVSPSFSALFPRLTDPRPLQLAIQDIPERLLAGPCLAILEAPTGEGKTEAALALAHRLAAASRTHELYYALPTMATSNQMYLRVQRFLSENLGLAERVKLVHGQSALIEGDLLIQTLSNGAEPSAALDWFGADKRKAMLMPFGVGTVDQAELAALNVRFTALRLAGLAGKVVIFDEVHAYDTYMTTIIEQLLKWLAALGSSVILLSATLPLAQRRRLAAAYAPHVSEQAPQAYPSLWVVSAAGEHQAAPPASQPERRIALDVETLKLGDQDAEAKARWLLEQVAQGGCACWIANTVERAQNIFAAVDQLADASIERMLLHAGFPLDDRLKLEDQLVQRYGPQGQRPERGIVVGTQVLEQSLDLDFDLLVSDLAPIDYLLQRAGRMHRHVGRVRPARHQAPRLWINLPSDVEGRPGLKSDRLIYAEYILSQTFQALQDRSQIVLPGDYRLLIEQVYRAEPPAPGSPLRAAWEQLVKQNEADRGQAVQRLLPDPDPTDSFCGAAARLVFDEDENRSGWIVAQTRLGEESITIIPCERQEGRAWLWPDGLELDLQHPAPFETQKQILRRSLRVSRKTVVRALRENPPELTPLFKESALLKECVPLWLTQGQTRLTAGKKTCIIQMDSKLGLVIKKGA